MRSTDTPWRFYGDEQEFRMIVNGLKLGEDGKVGVCTTTGEYGRLDLDIAPNAGDMLRLEEIVAASN